MHSHGRQSIQPPANRRTGKVRQVVQDRTRRHDAVVRLATPSSTKPTETNTDGRMEGNSHNFRGTLEATSGQMDAQAGFNPTPTFQGYTAMLHGVDEHLSGGYAGHQYMQQPHQQYMQQPHQPVEEDIEEDDVEEVPATQFPQTEGRKKGTSHRGFGFVADEDRVLCSGWLNVAKDATTGTNQDKIAFYKRLRQFYLDNYDPNSKRSVNSIQKRWSTIQTRVNEAIKEFQDKEPWKFDHCWQMLRDEPKWNNKVLELMQPTRGQEEPGGVETPMKSENGVSSMPARPEGRDSAKRRRASRFQDTASSSVAADMLKQLNDRGQQMDEVDSKHKEDLVNIERAKFELAEKQLQVKIDMSAESIKMTKELTQEKLKVQKEMKEAELKVQMHAIDVEQIKVDTQIMFTDTSKLAAGLREWVLKKQMDIMIRDGVGPAGAGSSSDCAGH